MNEIETLIKKLNTEKLFYNFNLHESVLDQSSNGSFSNDLQNQNDVVLNPAENGKDRYYKNKESRKCKNVVGDQNLEDGKKLKGCRKLKEKANNKHNNLSVNFKVTEKNYEVVNKNYNIESKVNEKKYYYFLKNYIFSFMSNMFLKKKENFEIKKSEFVKELKTDLSIKRDFVPPVNILYDDEKVVFIFFISGYLKDFNILSESNYITISGKKIPYKTYKHANYFSHEINSGNFMRKYYFMKPIDKEKIHYEHKNGVIKVFVYVSNDNVFDKTM